MTTLSIFKRRGFHFDLYLTDYQNFQRLSDFLCWNDEDYDFNYKIFEEQLRKKNHPEDDYLPFFLRYIENNGFYYDDNATEKANFSLLAKHMRWSRRACEEKRRLFEEQMDENGIEEYSDFSRDPSIFEFADIFQYFDYYVKHFDFQYDENKNAIEIFNDLCWSMDWNDLYYRNKCRFNSQQDKQNRQWLDNLIKDNKLKINLKTNRSLTEIFEDLAYELNWNDIRNEKKIVLDQFISEKVGRDLRSLKKLQEIIVFYEVDKDFNDGYIPKTIIKCRKLIKKYLFINIYDYIVESTQKFKTLGDLREYSIKNEMIFPLNEAKKDNILKNLLQPFFY